MKKYLIFVFIFYSLNSYSGLLLEPYGGVDFSADSKDASWLGLEIGGRIGYIWDIFMVGGDIDYKNTNVGYEYYDEDTKISNRGFFAGWMGQSWALRLKWYFDSDWRLDNGLTYSGHGLGIDGAFRLSKHLSINLELTKTNLNGNLDSSDVLISVSFPFDLVTK